MGRPIVNGEAQIDEIDCRYGPMLAFSADNVIGRSLRMYGEWAEHELSILRRYIGAGMTAVDVGANIGTHTVPFSRWVGDGFVIAIEAQPAVSKVLSANCERNGCNNVKVVNAVCADMDGSFESEPQCAAERNVGGHSFSGRRINLWHKLVRRLRFDAAGGIGEVPAVTLDELCAARPISFIKLDIEGMELEALHGARATIARCHPVVFFEQNSAERLAEIHDFLGGAGYRAFWLETQPFNQNNFRGIAENIWWRTETGIIAIPAPGVPPPGLAEVQRGDVSPPTNLNARVGIAVEP